MKKNTMLPMNTQFCLHKQVPTDFWSEEELAAANAAFERAGQIEQVVNEAMTNLVQSTQMYEEYNAILPKLRALYPLPTNSSRHRFQQYTDILLRIVPNIKKTQMSEPEALKINEALHRLQYAHAYGLKDLLGLRHFLQLLDTLFSSPDLNWKTEAVTAEIWNGFEKPENPSEWVKTKINTIDISTRQRNAGNLRRYQTILSSIEHVALKMANLNATDQELAEIDQAIKWKADYLSANSMDEKYTIASKILAFKHDTGRHALSPTLVLDASCFLAHTDNSNHLKSLAIKHIENIIAVGRLPTDYYLPPTRAECSIQ